MHEIVYEIIVSFISKNKGKVLGLRYGILMLGF